MVRRLESLRRDRRLVEQKGWRRLLGVDRVGLMLAYLAFWRLGVWEDGG